VELFGLKVSPGTGVVPVFPEPVIPADLYDFQRVNVPIV
jgi:hypothetical protein